MYAGVNAGPSVYKYGLQYTHWGLGNNGTTQPCGDCCSQVIGRWCPERRVFNPPNRTNQSSRSNRATYTHGPENFESHELYYSPCGGYYLISMNVHICTPEDVHVHDEKA